MKNWLLYNSKRLNDVLTVALLLIIVAVGVYVYVDSRSNMNNIPATIPDKIEYVTGPLGPTGPQGPSGFFTGWQNS